MDKRITTAITYKMDIQELDYVKEFLSNLANIKKELNKGDFWESFVKHQIKSGLQVVFIHLWNTKEQYFDGMHYKSEMVFEVYVGFNDFGMELYSAGVTGFDSIDKLCEKYESNPDFIFTELDWVNTKDVIIKDFLEDLKKGDIVID